MSGLLVPDEVAQRLARQQDKAIRAQVTRDNQQFTLIRTLAAAGEDLIEVMVNPDERLMFGLAPLDQALRGVGRKEVCFVTGRAHSGKTQLVLNMLVHNHAKRLIVFTPDEVDSLVLAKLVAITHGMNLEEMEEDVKAGSVKAKNLIRRTAAEVFPNLIVVDQTLTLNEMLAAVDEAQDHWGAQCDGMVLDFLDLLPGEADYTSTKGKSTGIKRWVKKADVPGIVIHQPKKTGAKRGQEIGMDDLHMAGDTEATFVLGVFRKQDDEDMDDFERLRHVETVTVHVSKNKRPPCKKGTWDFHLHPRTGRMRELTRSDFIKPGMPMRHWTEAQEAREAIGETSIQQPSLSGILPEEGCPFDGMGNEPSDATSGAPDEVR